MRRRSNSGTALLYAMLLMIVFAALGAAHVSRARAMALSHARDRADAHLDAALMGGVDLARAALQSDSSYVGEATLIGPAAVSISVDGEELRVAATTGAAPFAVELTRHVRVRLAQDSGSLPAIVSWTESP